MVKKIGFNKEKFVIPFFYNETVSETEIRTELEKNWGPVDYASEAMDFSYTSYYEKEMGKNLIRKIFSFENLLCPSTLAENKLRCHKLEKKWSSTDTKRNVNLDPGFISLSHFILATTKNNAHRIALRDGIYGELTLIYKDRDFRAFPWTYPDFQSEELMVHLRNIRKILSIQLKNI